MIKSLQAAAQIKSHDRLPGFWTWASSRFQKNWKRSQVHTKKDIGIPQQVYSMIILLVLPQSDLQPLTHVNIQWENGNLKRLLVPESELTLIPRDPKHHSALHYNWGIWNPVMTQVQPNMGPLGPQTHPVIISLTQIYNWNGHTW